MLENLFRGEKLSDKLSSIAHVKRRQATLNETDLGFENVGCPPQHRTGGIVPRYRRQALRLIDDRWGGNDRRPS